MIFLQYYKGMITKLFLSCNFKKSSTILLDGELQESAECDGMIGFPWPYAHGCTTFVIKWVLWLKTTLCRVPISGSNIQIHP